MARWFVNPRRRRRGRVHRPRVRVSKGRFLLGSRSPYKGRIHRVNPIIRNASIIRNPIIRNPFIREIGMLANPRRRHHRRHRRNRPYFGNPSIIRNPGVMGGVTHAIKDPMGLITQGAVGSASAFLTISLPNMLGLFMGADIMSKVLRALTRAAAGGLVYSGFRSFVPRHANAALTGAMIGAGGSFLFDLLGTRLVVGVGDTAQTPGMLFAGIGNLGNLFGGAAAPAGTAGYGSYVRPMGRLGSYTRPMGRVGMRGMAGVFGPGSMDALTGAGGDSIYG